MRNAPNSPGLTPAASIKWASTFVYQRSENSVGGNATVSPPVNDVRTMMTIGASRKAKTAPHPTRSRIPPSSRYRARRRRVTWSAPRGRSLSEHTSVPEEQERHQCDENNGLRRAGRPVQEHRHLLLDENRHHRHSP